MSKKFSKSERTKMIMEIDYLYGRVNEIFELYDEEDINEIKAHKLLRECCVKFLWKVNGISGGKECLKIS